MPTSVSGGWEISVVGLVDWAQDWCRWCDNVVQLPSCPRGHGREEGEVVEERERSRYPKCQCELGYPREGGWSAWLSGSLSQMISSFAETAKCYVLMTTSGCRETYHLKCRICVAVALPLPHLCKR